MTDFKVVAPITEFTITRSDRGVEEWLFVEGIASDTSWDKKKGRVYPEAIRRMREQINRPPVMNSDRVTVDSEHSDRWNEQIGDVVEARVIERADGPRLWVKRKIDLGLSAGRDLARSLEKGRKLAWSIYGQAFGHRDPEGREHFKRIELAKIRVTSRPVNGNTYLQRALSRSMNGDETLNEETTQEQESDAVAAVEAPAPSFGDRYRAFAAELTELLTPAQLRQLDALADTIMRGEPAPETPGPQPDDQPAPEVPAPATETPVEQAAVARSEDVDLSGFISRAELDEVRGLLNGATVLVAGQEETITVLRSELAENRAARAIEAKARNDKLMLLVKHVNSLTESFNSYLEQSAGRQGLVRRSMTEEDSRPRPTDEWTGLEQKVRTAAINARNKAGDGNLATKVMVGMATDAELQGFLAKYK